MTTVHGDSIVPTQPFALTIVKGLALAAALVLWAVETTRVAPVLLVAAALPFFVAGLLLGYAAADFLSGTVHWFCDTFFDESTPIIGQKVIRPFRDHHVHPEAITHYRVLEQDSSNYFVAVVSLWAALRFGGPSATSPFVHGFAWAFALGVIGTNLFHKWAHAEQVPFPVRWLQRHRLILSPSAHLVHHRAYTGGYCVTTGWMNALLDRIDFFGSVERLVRRLQGRRLPHPSP